MIQEEKQLLLKDLCARLPYGVEIICEASNISLTLSPHMLQEIWNDGNELQWKPYLRSMSSMTEEEFKEYHSMLIDVDNSGLMNQGLITKIVDWLDKKMFDHRNLIPKGLALKAPEGMYKSE